MAGKNLSAFIWSIADLLRDNYKKSAYAQIILPFTLLRRIDCVLKTTSTSTLSKKRFYKDLKIIKNPFTLAKSNEISLPSKSFNKKGFLSYEAVLGKTIKTYINTLIHPIQEIFESFEFSKSIDGLVKAKLLGLITKKFALIDLHPNNVSNIDII